MAEPIVLARGRSRTLTAAGWAVATLVTGVFVMILAHLVHRGVSGLSPAFLLGAPSDAGRSGGIGPIIASTILILAVCLAASVPIGLSTAVLLAEFASGRSRFGAVVRRSLDVLAGVPSIVFGLFGNAFFSVVLGMGFSIASGGLTLACMVLPILIRTAEEGLRAVPDEHRLGAAALGMSRMRTVLTVILPAAAPAIAAGLVLGIGRALAETAALLFTAGYVDRMPGSLLDSGRALSVHIYDLSMNVTGGESNAATTALVLVAMLLLINTGANALMHRWSPTGGRRS